MLVRLLPTGQMELRSLAQCLRTLFPGHDFQTISAREDPDGSRIPFESFTSGRLRPDIVPDALRRLVEQLSAEAHPGRSGVPADLAVLIDDLELENLDQVPVVADIVRRAVRAHLADVEHRRGALSTERVARALRERASFHVAVPMIESWLFGDPAALCTAGVPEERLPARLATGCDPEQFATDDPGYSADDGAQCTELVSRNARKRPPIRPRWILPDRPSIPHWRREAHPKAYLSWLCRDPGHERCSTYRESDGGAAALASLRWPTVLGAPSHFTWARALILDIASALNEPVPAFASGGACSTMPGTGSDPVLRNL